MAVGTAIAITGLVISAYSAWKQSKAAKDAGTAQNKAAESEAQIAEYNAAVADLQAKDARFRGGEAENRFRSQVRGVIGTERAGIASGNIDVGYGSAVDVQADAAFLGELDALTIRTNAAREAWGYEVQAGDLRARAAIARKTGYYASQAGSAIASSTALAGAGTLATNAGQLLMQRYGFKNPAPPWQTQYIPTTRGIPSATSTGLPVTQPGGPGFM